MKKSTVLEIKKEAENLCDKINQMVSEFEAKHKLIRAPKDVIDGKIKIGFWINRD